MTGDATDRSAIQRVYNEHAEYEYDRLERTALHEAEFALTVDLLEEYVGHRARVLDVGAGPGRYAEYLVNHKRALVGLVDLSAESLRLFQDRIGGELAGDSVLFCREGDAMDLEWLEPESFDVVLLMGPLYHLVSPDERAVALRGSLRALRPGGLLIASFISLYRSILQAIGGSKDVRVDIGPQDSAVGQVAGLLDTGQTSFMGMQQWRCWPAQARREMEAAGFDVIRMRNLEGVGMALAESNAGPPTLAEDKHELVDVLRLTCEIPDVLGATWHFVCVGRRA